MDNQLNKQPDKELFSNIIMSVVRGRPLKGRHESRFESSLVNGMPLLQIQHATTGEWANGCLGRRKT